MKRREKPERIRSAKALKVGSYTVAVCLAAIAAVVLLNLLVAQIPSSLTRQDVTQEGLFTLSEQTEQIVKGLDQDVTIYLVAETAPRIRQSSSCWSATRP